METGLALRLVGMSQWIMWELSALFENIGTVRDGINSISLPPTVDDAPGAPELPAVRGDIRFDIVALTLLSQGFRLEHFEDAFY